MRSPLPALLALGLAACLGDDPPPALDSERPTVRIDIGSVDGTAYTGIADAPLPETDHVPTFEIFAGSRSLEIAAVDAALDSTAGILAWIDPAGTLWVASLDGTGKRHVADDVILGLAVSHGRVAYAVRIDGPETAPFVADVRTLDRVALDDAPGPDEVLAISPDGAEVLVLSGRTGLASLFALGVHDASARQLTNVGLAPGPGLDTTRVAPTPIDRRDVAWDARGIAYRAATGWIRLEPAAEVIR